MTNRDKISLFFCILIGLLIQVITSLTWVSMPNTTLGNGDTTIGEAYMLCGQAVGEFIWILGIRIFALKGLFIAELLTEYICGLLIIDMLSIMFLSPFKVEMPKYASFLGATAAYLYRLKKYM